MNPVIGQVHHLTPTSAVMNFEALTSPIFIAQAIGVLACRLKNIKTLHALGNQHWHCTGCVTCESDIILCYCSSCCYYAVVFVVIIFFLCLESDS